jgi:hypothetical protein
VGVQSDIQVNEDDGTTATARQVQGKDIGGFVFNSQVIITIMMIIIMMMMMLMMMIIMNSINVLEVFSVLIAETHLTSWYYIL